MRPLRRRGRDWALFPAAAAGGDVTQGAAFSPMPLARLAEMARLRFVVVVVVAEFRIRGAAPRAVRARRFGEIRRGGLGVGKVMSQQIRHAVELDKSGID